MPRRHGLVTSTVCASQGHRLSSSCRPALGRILAQLPAPHCYLRAAPLIGPSRGHPVWLFPGAAARGHISAVGMARRLKARDIQPRVSRNAALIALAADLPMSMVSALFDVSIKSAANWSQRAGRAWHAYVAAGKA